MHICARITESLHPLLLSLPDKPFLLSFCCWLSLRDRSVCVEYVTQPVAASLDSCLAATIVYTLLVSASTLVPSCMAYTHHTTPVVTKTTKHIP